MKVGADDRVQRISVFGLGKLGAVVAGCHASKGFDVIGVDVSPDAVAKCAGCQAPVDEPGIDKLYEASRGHLTATLDAEAAVRDTDATLIVVPTPSNPDGSYSLTHAVHACEQIGRALRDKPGYHLVVMKSTVLPGAGDNELIPAIERASGRRCGADFGFAYNPEFIALGTVIRNIFTPDLALVGEADERAGALVADIYERLLEVEPPVSRMNVVNAELTKLSLNSYVTMKISFANSLARLCERMPGGDVDVVTAALGRDSRIGPKYIRGGLGFGGPCFPRDNSALLALAKRLGVPFQLAEATDSSNLTPALRAVEMVAEHAPEGARVAVLGLSYKPDTAVTEKSQGVYIARLLAERGFEVTAFDPKGMASARRDLPDSVKYAESADAAVQDHDVVLLTTPWKEFETLEFPRDRQPIVIDCWGFYSGRDDVRVVRLGKGPSRQANA